MYSAVNTWNVRECAPKGQVQVPEFKITNTEITNTEIFAFITVLVFKILSVKFCF